MEKEETKEAYHLLTAVCRVDDTGMEMAYRQMRGLLERFCRDQMQNESLQMTDLSARISFVAARVGLSIVEQNRLHTFRLTSNELLNRQAAPQREHLMRDAKTLAFFLKKLSGVEIPPELYCLLPRADTTYLAVPLARERIERMRVCFQELDEQFLYVTPLDSVANEPLRVHYNIPQVNNEFARTCELLWRYAQLNLLDVAVDEEGVLTPAFIVLEPDYLLDISSLAECFKEYGHHPANYLFARLQPMESTAPMLLGNIANLFLDEWIHADGSPDYLMCMQKAFRSYPIELAACTDLQDKEKAQQFFESCKLHFEHIRQVVTETFHSPGYELDKTDAVLEPTYICEALGLQGRLDYMQRDMSAFIEMKSGKGDEYSIRGKVEPKENNKVQMLLYQAVLQYSMKKDHRKVKAYLLYTRYPLLYPARPSWAMVRRAIDLRNRIVAVEHGVQLHNNRAYTTAQLQAIHADTLNERGLHGTLWERYLRPPIDRFNQHLSSLSALEQSYFYALYNFITKELYTSKSGDTDYDGRMGTASLWLSTLEEKCESGEILYDLVIKENHAAEESHATLLLSIPATDRLDGSLSPEQALPNFRQGDVVVLYERNTPTDNVTNRMVFKGTIERMAQQEVSIQLRASQQNASVLPSESLYAMEHDAMDTSYRNMYHGLSTFLSANQDRRDLLLMQRPPRFDESLDECIATAVDDFTRVALKAQAAKDYFLLVGPPGTGKTSRALRRMVELFYAEEQTHILLLSYTNRAVDEICKSLSSVMPAVDFIRVGSELSCDEAYSDRLMKNQLAFCTRRSEVHERIARCRIIVGTVAAIGGKPDLFRLKNFDVAIVDEATQILEPQLLGLLCARNKAGANAIGKFVLIGDHKQLPAVVLQRAEQSEVGDEWLRSIGLMNLKDSLFERLYRTATAQSSFSRCYDMLCRQGRMHPEVASFANHFFYGGRLQSLGLDHQNEVWAATPRVAFYPSQAEQMGCSAKMNHSEAAIVCRLAANVYAEYAGVFDSTRTLGIITPYRNQIALIKKEMACMGIAELNDVLVDTVERFQGSERDVIIYSFCVNYPYQLRFLSNLTQEEGVWIDRKLNVALTRARKQMLITGVPDLLRMNAIYCKLLDTIEESTTNL